MFVNAVRWARVTKSAGEDQQFAVQQVGYSGKLGDAAVVMPYGIHANLPVDSLALMFSVNAEPDNRAIIGYNPKNRPELAEGEVAFYHPPTDSFMIWRTSGDLDIQAGEGGGANINIIAAQVNVTASDTVTIESASSVAINGDSSVDINSPSVNLGVGGLAIARVGDPVTVAVVGGSSAGSHIGTITAGGLNTSL